MFGSSLLSVCFAVVGDAFEEVEEVEPDVVVDEEEELEEADLSLGFFVVFIGVIRLMLSHSCLYSMGIFAVVVLPISAVFVVAMSFRAGIFVVAVVVLVVSVVAGLFRNGGSRYNLGLFSVAVVVAVFPVFVLVLVFVVFPVFLMIVFFWNFYCFSGD